MTAFGTVAYLELLESITVVLTVTGLDRVTVPVTLTPPASEDGLRLTDFTIRGMTVRTVVMETPFIVAVIVVV